MKKVIFSISTSLVIMMLGMIVIAKPTVAKTVSCEVIQIMSSDVANAAVNSFEEDSVIIRCNDTKFVTGLKEGQKLKVKLDKKKKAIEGC